MARKERGWIGDGGSLGWKDEASQERRFTVMQTTYTRDQAVPNIRGYLVDDRIIFMHMKIQGNKYSELPQRHANVAGDSTIRRDGR